jgi:hypothetical protein
MRGFWEPFSASVEEKKAVSVSEVVDVLDALLADHFFPREVPAWPCGAGGTGAFGVGLPPPCRTEFSVLLLHALCLST